MMQCAHRIPDGGKCDRELGHGDAHQACSRKGHGPTCEGGSLHIRARCKTGCPQFQDGSWMARSFCVQIGTPHPVKRGRKRPAYGEANLTRDWLAANGIGDGSRS